MQLSKIMTKFIFVLSALVLSTSAFAQDVADPGNFSGDGMSTGFLGTRDNQLIAPSEIKCLLKSQGANDDLAQKTAENLSQALQIMNFDTSKMTRTCFMHFLAQIKAESGSGADMTEDAPKSAASTGYGYIQVTGKDNLEMAQKCMNEVSPGLGDGVVDNPNGTLGEGGNGLKAAVASFCWWRQNIVNNDQHDTICKDPTDDSDKKVTQIVNGGHVGAAVTGGMQNISVRESAFTRYQSAEQSCRTWSI